MLIPAHYCLIANTPTWALAIVSPGLTASTVHYRNVSDRQTLIVTERLSLRDSYLVCSARRSLRLRYRKLGKGAGFESR